MKILLSQSPLGPKESVVFPQGICCVATSVKAKHDLKVFDPNIEVGYQNKLRELIASFQPDVIGVSLRNIDTTRINDPKFYYLVFLDFLVELKTIAPDVTIIAGGAGFSIFPERLMELCKEIDFGVHLEAEESFPELLENLNDPAGVKGVFIRDNEGVIYTGDRNHVDVAALPIVDRSFIDINKYRLKPFDIGIETKRGCMLNCAYCCYPHLNGKGVRLRTPGQVVDEIEELIEKYTLKNFTFIDSVFDVPKNHCVAIVNEIISRKIKIDWSAWFSGREFDEDLFFLFVKAGCKDFSFSPDAYTTKALKGLNKYIRHKDIIRIYNIFKKHAVETDTKVSFNFFINSPEIGLVDFFRTLFFCVKAKIVLGDRLSGIGTDYIRIMPFTLLYNTALKKKRITPETNLLPDTIDDYKGIFYHEPGSMVVDGIFMSFQKIKSVIKKILGIDKFVDDGEPHDS